jgi:hypothetical protein
LSIKVSTLRRNQVEVKAGYFKPDTKVTKALTKTQLLTLNKVGSVQSEAVRADKPTPIITYVRSDDGCRQRVETNEFVCPESQLRVPTEKYSRWGDGTKAVSSVTLKFLLDAKLLEQRGAGSYSRDFRITEDGVAAIKTGTYEKVIKGAYVHPVMRVATSEEQAVLDKEHWTELVERGVADYRQYAVRAAERLEDAAKEVRRNAEAFSLEGITRFGGVELGAASSIVSLVIQAMNNIRFDVLIRDEGRVVSAMAKLKNYDPD